jgi:hypothetical protein
MAGLKDKKQGFGNYFQLKMIWKIQAIALDTQKKICYNIPLCEARG